MHVLNVAARISPGPVDIMHPETALFLISINRNPRRKRNLDAWASNRLRSRRQVAPNFITDGKFVPYVEVKTHLSIPVQ